MNNQKVELYGDGVGAVEYVEHMGSDLSVVNAARVSFGKHKGELDGKDERFLADATAMKRKRNLPDATLTDQFRTFIVSVNGHTDQKAINEFVEKMPAFDSRFLRTTYAKAVPNIDMSQDFICNNCDYEAAMEVPLSADFFWPK